MSDALKTMPLVLAAKLPNGKLKLAAKADDKKKPKLKAKQEKQLHLLPT